MSKITCNLKTITFREFCANMLFSGTLVGDGKCAMSWCDLDLTFDLTVVTLTYKILPRLYLRNCKA